MIAFLFLLFIVLLSVSLGGIYGLWLGGIVGGALLLLTYWFERLIDVPMRIGGWSMAVLAPLVWGVTGGFYLVQSVQMRQARVKAPALQPLQSDLEATASLRSEQGKEVYHLKVEKDKVIYTLEIRYRKGLKPKIPNIPAHPTFHGPFLMPKPPKIRFIPATKGVVVKRWELTLTPVLTGPLDTPRFEIKYRKKGKLKKVVVEPIAIEVSELGKPTKLLATLRPGKAPMLIERPSNPRQIFWWSCFGLAFMLFGGSFWLLGRRKEDEIQLTAHEWVSIELEQLEKQKLVEKGEFKKFYFSLSGIFRGYLERRFDFAALESTTEEIVRWTKQQDRLNKEHAREVRHLLQWMDSVKFANHQPSGDEQEDLEVRLVRFIEETRPTPEEERESKASAEASSTPDPT